MMPRRTQFWTDAFKGMLVTAIPLLAFDLALQQPAGAGLLGVLFVTVGVVLVPLMMFVFAALALYLFVRRRPGWFLGPALMLFLNGAFVHAIR
jgi:hypothetical protein